MGDPLRNGSVPGLKEEAAGERSSVGSAPAAGLFHRHARDLAAGQLRLGHP